MMTMLISLDTGDPSEVRRVKEWGFPIDKITSNPTTIAATMKRTRDSVYDVAMHLRDEAGHVPISIEAIGSESYDSSRLGSATFIREAEIIDSWGKDFVVKLPAVAAGFEAAKEIDFMPVNFTLVFSQHQGYLAGDYGGAYASPFIGRYDDKLKALGIPGDGTDLADEIVRNFRSFGFATKVLVASVRSITQIETASVMGAHAITMPFNIFRELQDNVSWLKELRERTVPHEPPGRKPTFSGR